MSLPENIFQKVNASKYAAQTPPELETEYGPGRLFMFDTIHMLHCVVIINTILPPAFSCTNHPQRALWKLAYPEYYNITNTSKWPQEKQQDWILHIDHCADMLRQKLMCDASSTIVPYNWLENHYHPHPNFHAEHKCRDYNEILEAAKKYRIEGVPVEGIFRPKNRAIHEFDIEPPYDPLAEGKVTGP